MKKVDIRLWSARALLAVVMGWNLECALVFLLNPAAFSPGFELAGVAGAAAVRGTAVLFVMWNVPYVVALWQPRKHRLSLIEALVMQCVGVIGESLIFLSIPSGHAMLAASLGRFIFFDAAGVVLLLISALVSRS